MFAVKGWAISADSLKTETEKPSQAAAAASSTEQQQQQQQQSSKSNKRKRQSTPTPSNVTAANVADLWQQVIEGKSGKKAKIEKSPGDAKKQPNGHVKSSAAVPGSGGDADGGHYEHGEAAAVPKLSRKERKKANKEKAKLENAGNDDAGATESHEPPAKKSKKDKKSKKKQEHTSGSRDDDVEPSRTVEEAEEAEEEPAAVAAAAPPAPPKLTPLQAAMREKLISARFRHLNETLYTRPSAEAFALFRESPEMFREYHEGFRRQVDVWPENPVDGYVAEIRARGAVREPHRHDYRSKHGRSNHNNKKPPRDDGTDNDNNDNNDDGAGGIQPLPRTSGTCTIADLGCGDAKLAASLAASQRKLRLAILSYDLQSEAAAHVTRADIADLPRADASVDVAVFCLALMGTNWPDFVEEAYRVLRWRGELWVAEIKSRFAAPAAAARGGGTVTHSVGFRKKAAATQAKGGKSKGKGKGAAQDDEDGHDDAADLAVEVDGAEDHRRGGTDVTAFVDALRRRGFVLQGAPDLRNRMFVRMRFLKAAPAVVGKCAAPPKNEGGSQGRGQGQGPGQGQQRRPQPQSLAQRRDAIKRFIGDGDGEGERQGKVDESGILKPCVYKIR